MVYSIKCEMIGWWWIRKNMEEYSCGSLILRYYPSNCLDKLRKLMINLSKDTWPPGWNMNPGSVIYESWVLTITLWHSVLTGKDHTITKVTCYVLTKDTTQMQSNRGFSCIWQCHDHYTYWIHHNCDENSRMSQNVQSSPMFISAIWPNIYTDW
jgi:hypothetical protein